LAFAGFLMTQDLLTSVSSAASYAINCLREARRPQSDHEGANVGFAVQPEDRPVLDELVAYFGDGNRSAYLRATLKVMKSVMIANQLREAQAYGQQRTAELGIDPADVPARIQAFMKGSRPEKGE
jgi:hypothetical protein